MNSLQSATRFTFALLSLFAAGCFTCLPQTAERFAPATPESTLHYEIVSIRESTKPDADTGVLTTAADMVTLRMSLHDLVSYTYQVRPQLVVGGPKWADSRLFEITAKVAAPDVPVLREMKWKARGPLLVPVLADRFGLKIHHETRTMDVYDLVVSKKGDKLQQTTAAAGDKTLKLGAMPIESGNVYLFGDYIRGVAVDMPTVARVLTSHVDRVILDRTGLTGVYNFQLNTAEASADATQAPVQTNEDPPPPMAVALHDQAGLDLKRAREDVDVLVIDSAILPSAN